MNEYRRFPIALFALALAIVCLSPAAAQAATFNVTKSADTNDGSCAPSDCSLREAITAANAAAGADVVNVPAGTYTLTLGTSLAITEDLTVAGAGSDKTIISGNDATRVFDFISAGTTHTLRGLSMVHGRASIGTAVYSNAGSLLLDDTVSRDNNSTSGATGSGTIALAGSASQALIVRNSTVTGNRLGDATHGGSGGAIFASSGLSSITFTVNIENSNLSGNSVGGGGPAASGFGGAMVLSHGGNNSKAIATVSNSIISGNTAGGNGASGFGAGIDLDAGGANPTLDLQISNSTIASNRAGGGGASGFGGGIDLSTGGANATQRLKISGSTISGNTVGGGTNGNGFGGGLDQSIGGGGSFDMEIVNSTFANNLAANGVATGYGAGLSISGGPGTRLINNSTIAGNQIGGTMGSGGSGAGLAGAAYATVRNTIIAGNSGGDPQYTNCDDPVITLGHNIENLNTCAFNGAGDKSNTDPKLGPLTDNGGPTQTRALLFGSPAINAADANGCPTTDQRGGSRPQPPGAACDIGAVEFGSLADLQAGIKATPATLGQGDAITLEFTATNNGPDEAAGVRLTGALPAGYAVKSVKPSQGSCAKSGIDCSIGTLVKAAVGKVTVKAMPSKIAVANVTASVGGNPTDPNPANNTATARTDTRLGLSGLAVSPRTVKPAVLPIAIDARKGATVRFRLFEKARVRFTVERAVRGHKSKGKCRPGKGKGGRCTAYKKVRGGFSASGKKGLNKRRFSGRVGGRKLGKGKYRLVAVARKGKQSSLTKRTSFRVR